MLRKEIISTLIGLAIFGALTGLLLEVMIEGDAAKFKQFAEKIKGNTLVLFETAQMAIIQNMISSAEVGFELSTTQVDPDSTPNNGDEYILNQVSECVFSGPEDIPFPTCLICQLSDQKCVPKVMCPECEKPTIFTVLYKNSQFPDIEVKIEVYKEEGDFGDPDKLLAEFDGVMDGDEITIDSRFFINDAQDTVHLNTAYRVIIFEDEVEAGVTILTSCSEDLFIGDVHIGEFGVSFTVISGTDADLNPTIHDGTCEESGNQSDVNVLVEGEKILEDGYLASTRETIPLPTGPENSQNDIQNVQCVVLKVCGPPKDGCTPGYWKQEQHFDNWIDFTTGQSVGSVFDQATTPEPFDKTLLEALNFGGGEFGQEGKVLRAAVAAILSASNDDVNYPIEVDDIIMQVNAAIASGDNVTMEDLKDLLDSANNLGCPLNGN